MESTKMTDKELLEQAAKAAGMDHLFWNDGKTTAYYSGSLFYMTTPGSHTPWNPLTDDGDAMRLVVKLGLALVVGNVNDYIAVQSDRLPEVIHSDKTDDPYAAARRAIVRAAAEIGKEGNE